VTELDPGHRGIGVEPEPPLSEPPPEPREPREPRRDGDGEDAGLDPSRVLWLLVGALAIAAGTALGWNSEAIAGIVNPPAPIRSVLVGVSAGLGVILLLGALNRLSAADDDGWTGRRPSPSSRDIATMIRGVRLVFLGVAAFAAAGGWLLGHPLPLVVALVIAGVDVLETSFLLIVVGLRNRG
jgi:hypothetical protein